MFNALPKYDELFVVSDIHMGGRSGFQMFNKGARLGKLIQFLAEYHPKKEVALVMNGDIFDSLSEGISGYIAIRHAESMMDRISCDPAFKPVWDGLTSFVGKPRRHLILVMGNHDLELALPNTQFWIRERIAAKDSAVLGRISISTNGSGHACMVGDARIFCSHGNEVDDWNVVDQELLAKLSTAINAGRFYPPAKFKPNAGTRLVVDVMNTIKQQYPFVDLLKPETATVVPILLVLDPGRVKDVIYALPKVSSDLLWGMLERRGILSAEALTESDDSVVADGTLNLLIGNNLKEEMGLLKAPEPDARSMLLAIEKDIVAGKPLHQPSAPDGEVATLGTIGLIIDRIRGIPKVEALRRALLDWLENDDTFSIDKRDETFKRITAKVGASVDFIITGHTHLARAIPISEGHRFYYNCGTWTRLLGFSVSILKDQDRFESVFNILRSVSIEDIDDFALEVSKGERADLIRTWTTAVHVFVKQKEVHGEILEISEDPNDAIQMNPVKGTHFIRK